MNNSTRKSQHPRHVEVAVRKSASQSLSQVKKQWQDLLPSLTGGLSLGLNGEINWNQLPPSIQQSCVKACIVNDDDAAPSTSSSTFVPGDPFMVHTYEMSEEELHIEELEPVGGDDEWTAGCDNLTLPHITLDGMWEALIFDSKVKRHLLDYAQSALLFSDKNVSSHIINWNRVLLLNGPPGTGKTTLCRALAHKLAIRLGHRFSQSTLLEIHSHSLFSKWFSTSGKLVSALFQMVRDMVEDDPSTLVCVLIDEVESLASSRNNSAASGDPSDAMRAVNSLLTSLDRLKCFPNVLVLATTNLTGSIDAAFLDRVDLKLHIGLPILRARYRILQTCLEELFRVGIIVTHHQQSAAGSILMNFDELDHEGEHKQDDAMAVSSGHRDDVKRETRNLSWMLLRCAQEAEGLSGRSLRKLPLQAYAQYLSDGHGIGEGGVSLDFFLDALFRAIDVDKKACVDL